MMDQGAITMTEVFETSGLISDDLNEDISEFRKCAYTTLNDTIMAMRETSKRLSA